MAMDIIEFNFAPEPERLFEVGDLDLNSTDPATANRALMAETARIQALEICRQALANERRIIEEFHTNRQLPIGLRAAIYVKNRARDIASLAKFDVAAPTEDEWRFLHHFVGLPAGPSNSARILAQWDKRAFYMRVLTRADQSSNPRGVGCKIGTAWLVETLIDRGQLPHDTPMVPDIGSILRLYTMVTNGQHPDAIDLG